MAKMYEWKSEDVKPQASRAEMSQYSKDMVVAAQAFIGSSNFHERNWQGAASGLVSSLKRMPHSEAFRWAVSIGYPSK